ncbi:hypothetical protein FRC20_008962 [Serendipita sp. 405]|nr:hypothetical protein FRC20_008962 [Serendipita sp. 405]
MSRSQPQPPVLQNRPKPPTKGPKPKHFITFQTGLDVKKALSVSDITQLVTNLNAAIWRNHHQRQNFLPLGIPLLNKALFIFILHWGS